MPSGGWLTDLIRKSAVELEKAGKTSFQFSQAVARAFDKMPVQAWEADGWTRGLKLGLIRLEGHFFRVGAGKRGILSFFVRNTQGLLVGLRRESITQAATYVTLITDLGYPRERTRFETGWMDVAVFRENGQAFIYAENKANAKTLGALCRRLGAEFAEGVPFNPLEEESPDDAVNKAQHLWRHRPAYFWGVAPTVRYPFRVDYGRGVTLTAMDKIPCGLEWDGPGSSPGRAPSYPLG